MGRNGVRAGCTAFFTYGMTLQTNKDPISDYSFLLVRASHRSLTTSHARKPRAFTLVSFSRG